MFTFLRNIMNVNLVLRNPIMMTFSLRSNVKKHAYFAETRKVSVELKHMVMSHKGLLRLELDFLMLCVIIMVFLHNIPLEFNCKRQVLSWKLDAIPEKLVTSTSA